MKDFADKAVVISGGAGGIAGATATILRERGAHLMLVDRDEGALAEAAARIREQTPDATGDIEVHVADVTVDADVTGYVAAAEERFGGIDGFFNNAGIEGPTALTTEFSVTDFDRVMAVNARGVFLGLHAVLPGMIERGRGAIVTRGRALVGVSHTIYRERDLPLGSRAAPSGAPERPVRRTL